MGQFRKVDPLIKHLVTEPELELCVSKIISKQNKKFFTRSFVSVEDVENSTDKKRDERQEDADDDADGRRRNVVVQVGVVVPDVDADLIDGAVLDDAVAVAIVVAAAVVDVAVVVVVVLWFELDVGCFVGLSRSCEQSFFSRL